MIINSQRRAAVMAHHRLLLPRNNLVAQNGDSRIYQGGGGYVGNEAAEIRSPTSRFYGSQYWIESASQGRVSCPSVMNFGKNGDTSGPHGSNPGATSRIGDVIASGAGACLVCVGINDRGSENMTSDQTIANLNTILTLLPAAGIPVFITAELLKGNIATYPTFVLAEPQLTYQYTVHNWILAQDHRYGVYVIDAWPTMALPGTTQAEYIAADTDDGLHPNLRGGRVWGAACWDRMAPFYASYPSVLLTTNNDVYNPATVPNGNLIANGMMAGTGGTGASSGTVPDNWVVTNTAGCAIAATAQATIDGNGDWAKFHVTGTPTAANPSVVFAHAIPLANLTSGDLVAGLMEYYVENASNVASVRTRLRWTFSAGSPASQASIAGDNVIQQGLLTFAPFRGVAEMHKLTVDTGTVATAFLDMAPQLIQNQAVDLTVYIRAASAKKQVDRTLVSSLLIDPVSSRYNVNGSSFSATNLVTITRASAKYALNASGVLTAAASNALPVAYHYSGSAFVADGWMIEPARTTILLRSEAIDNASWIKSGSATVTADQTTDPTGGSGGDLVTLISSSSNVSQTITVASSTTYTFQCYIKLGTLAQANYKIAFRDQTNNAFILADVVPTFGTILPNGWVQISAQVTTPGTCVSMRCYIYSNTGLAAGATFYAWGAMLTLGTFLSSYIVTTNAAVTYPADTTSTYIPFRAADDTTLLGSAYWPSWTSTDGFIIEQVDDGTDNNRVCVVTRSGNLRAEMYVAGVLTASVTGPTIAAATTYKYAVAFDGTHLALTVNGVDYTQAVPSSVPSGILYLRYGCNVAGSGQPRARVMPFLAYAGDATRDASLLASVASAADRIIYTA